MSDVDVSKLSNNDLLSYFTDRARNGLGILHCWWDEIEGSTKKTTLDDAYKRGYNDGRVSRCESKHGWKSAEQG